MKPIDLKAVRKEFNRTQQAVAEAAGISLRQYQNYESGKTPITDKVKDELIRAIHENTKKPSYLDIDGQVLFSKTEKELYVEVLKQNGTIQMLVEAVAVLWGKYKGVTDFEALRELRQKEKEWQEDQLRR